MIQRFKVNWFADVACVIIMSDIFDMAPYLRYEYWKSISVKKLIKITIKWSSNLILHNC